MKLMNRLGDALLTRVAPKAKAAAADCQRYTYKCVGVYLYKCGYDTCAKKDLGCVYIGQGC